MNVKKYRKKPIVIEAIMWGGNFDAVKAFCPIAVDNSFPGRIDVAKDSITIPTLEGDHLADFGDYIIKGVKGEFYPCKPDIFELTYEEVA